MPHSLRKPHALRVGSEAILDILCEPSDLAQFVSVRDDRQDRLVEATSQQLDTALACERRYLFE